MSPASAEFTFVEQARQLCERADKLEKELASARMELLLYRSGEIANAKVEDRIKALENEVKVWREGYETLSRRHEHVSPVHPLNR